MKRSFEEKIDTSAFIYSIDTHIVNFYNNNSFSSTPNTNNEINVEKDSERKSDFKVNLITETDFKELK